MGIESLRKMFLSHKEMMENVIKQDLYRYQRYHVPFSVAVFYSKDGVLEMIERFIRQTDSVVVLDEHAVCIIYGNVGYEEAFKASQNILHDISNEYPRAKVSGGLTSVSGSDIPNDLLQRAFRNLGHAIENSQSSVEDDTVIDFLVKDGFRSIR